MRKMQEIIDTHAHLEEIKELQQNIIAAKKANVGAIIAVGSDLKSNQRVLEIARLYPEYVFPALGLYPGNINPMNTDDEIAFIKKYIEEIVAIGEIGLDYHKNVLELISKDTQKQTFVELLKVAVDYHKVALIHSRYSWKDCLRIVLENKVEKAVFHWYTGPLSTLNDILNHGYYISASPAVEYHLEHQRAIRETPLDRLLLETDTPVVYARGSKDEFQASPVDLNRSLVGTARLKNIPVHELAAQTTKNAAQLFGLKRERQTNPTEGGLR